MLFVFNKITNNKSWPLRSPSSNFMSKEQSVCDTHTHSRQSTLGCDNLWQGTAELFLDHILKGKWPKYAAVSSYRTLNSDPGPHRMLSDLLTCCTDHNHSQRSIFWWHAWSLFTDNITVFDPPNINLLLITNDHYKNAKCKTRQDSINGTRHFIEFNGHHLQSGRIWSLDS